MSFKEQVESIKELDQSVEILVRFLCAVPGWSEKNVKVPDFLVYLPGEVLRVLLDY